MTNMNGEHCVYVTRGRKENGDTTWRVGITTRPSVRPKESFRENQPCLGELDHVSLMCGLDKETAKSIEVGLIDVLSGLNPAGKCNLIRR